MFGIWSLIQPGIVQQTTFGGGGASFDVFLGHVPFQNLMVGGCMHNPPNSIEDRTIPLVRVVVPFSGGTVFHTVLGYTKQTQQIDANSRPWSLSDALLNHRRNNKACIYVFVYFTVHGPVLNH